MIGCIVQCGEGLEMERCFEADDTTAEALIQYSKSLSRSINTPSISWLAPHHPAHGDGKSQLQAGRTDESRQHTGDAESQLQVETTDGRVTMKAKKHKQASSKSESESESRSRPEKTSKRMPFYQVAFNALLAVGAVAAVYIAGLQLLQKTGGCAVWLGAKQHSVQSMAVVTSAIDSSMQTCEAVSKDKAGKGKGSRSG